VGLGTGIFYDPLAAQKINQGIQIYLGKRGLSSVSDLVGRLNLS
jgi:dihydroorotate dehydrogenase